MQVIRSLAEIRFDTPTVATLGTFDGVHRGHELILGEVLRIARETGRPSVLVTFDPHPREVLQSNGAPLSLLTLIEERIELLERLSFDACVVIPFTLELSRKDAETFFAEVLVGAVRASHVIVGEDHAFGRGRQGNVEALREYGERYGVEITVVDKLLNDGLKISSSAIRKALAVGDVATARIMLGRPYQVDGKVVAGDKLGRTIGFATANIEPVSEKKQIPANGVYAAIVRHEGATHEAVLNIGVRPTVTDIPQRRIEVHILDFDRDIYGATLDVAFIERLRDEQKFESLEALTAQLRTDVQRAGTALHDWKNETSIHIDNH